MYSIGLIGLTPVGCTRVLIIGEHSTHHLKERMTMKKKTVIRKLTAVANSISAEIANLDDLYEEVNDLIELIDEDDEDGDVEIYG